ncbi:MAG: anthranilate synthase component I [Spirochaetes bacterium GWF1_51_8]|nr:MAG: anthranilate synthase component I [Spirochaetes bacterium GWF1_51_8]
MLTDKVLYPVYREIAADIETPVSAFLALKEEGKMGFLLESVEMGEKLGRYSFLGFDPELIFTAKKNRVKISFMGETEEMECGNPIDEIKKVVASFKEERDENLPPFSAGLVGYFSYDSVRYFEKLPDIKPDKLDLPDIFLIMPKVLIAFDHIKQKLILIGHAFSPEGKAEALAGLKEYETRLFSAAPPERIKESNRDRLDLISNFKKAEFIAAVEKAKKHIVAGDIFQVVLSQRLRTGIDIGPFDIYRKLRMINPSPYMFYMDFSEFQLVGSSPEVMVRRTKTADKDEVIVRPIAGTRPRGKNKKEDDAVELELLNDVKELAEHTMLLDLARNDVGRISGFNTVRVEAPYHIERYSHVMHIVSDVLGKPNPEFGAVDIIGATFPAGTVSGSPKVRAMEIIEDLEPEKRGIYAGAIGYIDFSGNTDTCIAIRTILHRDKTVYIQAGAGIVYDSVPEKEYEETINKAKALMKAII